MRELAYVVEHRVIKNRSIMTRSRNFKKSEHKRAIFQEVIVP